MELKEFLELKTGGFGCLSGTGRYFGLSEVIELNWFLVTVVEPERFLVPQLK